MVPVAEMFNDFYRRWSGPRLHQWRWGGGLWRVLPERSYEAIAVANEGGLGATTTFIALEFYLRICIYMP